ncbi:ABC transporter ATP-binding protein, partial [Streptomyces sp. SID7803]|nr:ABC transporter ATP-binding protein [Streptomyces sp. SID7803]
QVSRATLETAFLALTAPGRAALATTASTTEKETV